MSPHQAAWGADQQSADDGRVEEAEASSKADWGAEDSDADAWAAQAEWGADQQSSKGGGGAMLRGVAVDTTGPSGAVAVHWSTFGRGGGALFCG
jgi:hypothetical protein